MARGRSTKAEANYRLNKVAKLLSTGHTRSQIMQLAADDWGIKERQTDQYIADARKILKEDFDIDRRQFTAEMLSQLATLQKEARNNSQLSVALGCINSMAKIAQVMS